jgi:hypothetical protein
MIEQKSLLTELGEAIDRYRLNKQVSSRSRASDPPHLTPLRRLLRWLTPNGGTLLLVILLIATAQVWAKPLTNLTAAPGPSATTINYQGRLSDSDGIPLDGTYGMTFALYDALTDGNLIWGPEAYTAVEVSDGLFSVGLGSRTSGGIPTTTWNGDRYLEITVAGETLEPRELIRSVPIAGTALTVPDGAITSEKLAITSWSINDSSETYWTTDIQDQYVPVPGIDFSFTPSVDGVVMLNLSTTFWHSVPGTTLYCAITINGAEGAKSKQITPDARNCSTNLVYPVENGTAYTFRLEVYASQEGTFTIQKGHFTNLSAVFFGTP